MSCAPASYTLTPAGTALASAPVAALLDLFQEALPWLSHRYGLVQTATRKADRKTERIPQAYRQDGTRQHFDALPAEDMQAMCFFERDGRAALVWDDGGLQLGGTWQHPLSLVVWCNLPKIDPARAYDFSDELAADVLRVLVEAGVPVSGVEQRAEEVFKRYTLDDKKLLMHPFAGFKVPLVLQERYRPCVTAFQPLPADAE